MNKELTPGIPLVGLVRGGLVTKGTSLHQWCIENGIRYPNARQALIGTWNGPKGSELRKRLLKAAGLVGDEEAA